MWMYVAVAIVAWVAYDALDHHASPLELLGSPSSSFAFNHKHVRLVTRLARGELLHVRVYPKAQLYAAPLVDALLESFPRSARTTVTRMPDDATSALQTLATDVVPDIVILSLTELNKYAAREVPGAYTIVISGEAVEVSRAVDSVISPCQQPQSPAAFFYPYLYQSYWERNVAAPSRLYHAQKHKATAFLYHRSLLHRDLLASRLAQLTPVDALGRVHPPGLHVPTDGASPTRHVHASNGTYLDLAVRAYLPYKFVIAVESVWSDGYFTEKLLNPLLAHAIPLYWGHPMVFQYINKGRVIDLSDYGDIESISYNMTGLLAAMAALETNPVAFDQFVSQPWWTTDGHPDRVWGDLRRDLKTYFHPDVLGL